MKVVAIEAVTLGFTVAQPRADVFYFQSVDGVMRHMLQVASIDMFLQRSKPSLEMV